MKYFEEEFLRSLDFGQSWIGAGKFNQSGLEKGGSASLSSSQINIQRVLNLPKNLNWKEAWRNFCED